MEAGFAYNSKQDVCLPLECGQLDLYANVECKEPNKISSAQQHYSWTACKAKVKSEGKWQAVYSWHDDH